MRIKLFSVAVLMVCGFAGAAWAADATFDAPDAGNALHAVNGKPYWEMFAMCFSSVNAALAKAARDKDETQQRDLSDLAASLLERGISRLVDDRTVFEGEAEEVFYARAAQSMPVANFADACRLYIKDHDSRFGTSR
ncbi:MAG TPA: hypothetical protein VNH44_00535 [Micropepsaceae bacterium]|nr:hypothetical protein [Micropepsaceae bacterium]